MQRVKAKKAKARKPTINARPRRATASRSAAAAAGSPHTVNLGDHTKAYMQCLINPIGSQPAGMPSMGGVNSLKFKCFARGAASTGSAGFGFLNVTPGFGVARDERWGFVSTAAFAGTTMNETAAGIAYFQSNSTYVLGDFLGSDAAATVSYRLVGCGARIRYFGTELNKAGLVFSLIHPEHEPLNNSTSYPLGAGVSDLRTFESCSADAFDRDWHELDYTGFIYPNEQEYHDQVVIPGLGGTDDPAPFYNYRCMAIAIECPAPTPLPFEYEVWGIYEVVGPSVRGTTATVADPVGVSIVTSGAQQANARSQDHHGTEAHVTAALTAIGSTAMTAMTHIGPAIKKEGFLGAVGHFVKEHGPSIIKRVAPLALALL